MNGDSRDREIRQDQSNYERWRGQIDEQLRTNARDRDDLRAEMRTERANDLALIADIQKQIVAIQLQIGTITTRIGTYSAIGGLIGSVIVGLVIALLTGQLK